MCHVCFSIRGDRWLAVSSSFGESVYSGQIFTNFYLNRPLRGSSLSQWRPEYNEGKHTHTHIGYKNSNTFKIIENNVLCFYFALVLAMYMAVVNANKVHLRKRKMISCHANQHVLSLSCSLLSHQKLLIQFYPVSPADCYWLWGVRG